MNEHSIVVIGLSIFYPVVITAAILFIRSMQTFASQGQRAWQEAAEKHGLQVVETGRTFRARTGRLEVRLDILGNREEKTRLSIKIPGPPDLHQVKIRPETAKPHPLEQWSPEIKVGDERFDAAFRIEGPAGLVLALLDAQTRRLLLDGNAGIEAACAPELFLGELQAVVFHEKVLSMLPHFLDVGQRLARPIDVVRRVADNALRDPEAGVRMQNLLLLAREFPETPVTRETLRAACSDPSPQIRLRAAKELGAEGRDILLRFAESEENDALSAGAVSILDRELPFERVRSILLNTLRKRLLLTARACLEWLGRGGASEAVDLLSEVMEREQGELAVAAAQALGTTGSPAAEPSLILALQREPADLRVAAANALGRIGSVAAVLPLKEAAARDPGLLRAARQAVAEIHSRLPAAAPGQLSLGEAEAGRLSLAQSEAGQLSMAHAEIPLLPHAADEPEQPAHSLRETPGRPSRPASVRQG